MVRNYKRKTDCTRKYNKDDIAKLADEFGKFRGSLREFARLKEIPRSTVQRWVKGLPSSDNPGRRPTLTAEEEMLIVTALKYLADANMPLDRDDLRDLVTKFVEASGRKTPFI